MFLFFNIFHNTYFHYWCRTERNFSPDDLRMFNVNGGGNQFMEYNHDYVLGRLRIQISSIHDRAHMLQFLKKTWRNNRDIFNGNQSYNRQHINPFLMKTYQAEILWSDSLTGMIDSYCLKQRHQKKIYDATNSNHDSLWPFWKHAQGVSYLLEHWLNS